MYHGIIIDQQFKDKNFLNNFKVFAKKQDGSWGIFGIEIEDKLLDKTIDSIQQNMDESKPWYAHLYDDKSLIIIFKSKIIKVTPHKSTWSPIVEYGKTLNIPEKQLDFWPNRFQDEIHYFEKN
ncbi:MAG: hypothetical protein Q7S14_01085 [bacterium]|nr:hypothetical protein [bacterium]